jgi:hypothetical protein
VHDSTERTNGAPRVAARVKRAVCARTFARASGTSGREVTHDKGRSRSRSSRTSLVLATDACCSGALFSPSSGAGEVGIDWAALPSLESRGCCGDVPRGRQGKGEVATQDELSVLSVAPVKRQQRKTAHTHRHTHIHVVVREWLLWTRVVRVVGSFIVRESRYAMGHEAKRARYFLHSSTGKRESGAVGSGGRRTSDGVVAAATTHRVR